MKLSDTISIRPQVVARIVGNETVILDLESGTYFALDNVGARIWLLLEAGKSLLEVCDVIVQEFEVSRDELDRDVLALVRDLLDKKLIAAS
jgi:hypothetical protein